MTLLSGGRQALATGLAMVATLAVANPAPAAAGVTGEIRYAGSATAVDGSYLVVLRDGAVGATAGTRRAIDAVPDLAAGLARRYGGSVTRVYGAALNGFAARLTESAAKRLAGHPDVAYVEQDRTVTANAVQRPTPSWGIDRIDQRALPLNQTYNFELIASGVRAYIIDSGMSVAHPDFSIGRATSGYDAIDGGTADDCNGHGTHVGGTVGGRQYGVAKDVKLVAVRVIACVRPSTVSEVIAGVNWVAANAVKPAVATLAVNTSASTALDNAVGTAVTSGVTFVVSAGNDAGNACNYSPARVPTAITVGATSQTDQRAAWSNTGVCLDLFAPGVSITSAWYTSTAASMSASGTSMAAAHVAGAAALVLAANPTFTPVQVRDALVAKAIVGIVPNPGTGSPNRLLHVGP
ncbi:S8 family peptidase [Micromonospora sp. NPDC047074]|uniref:S8 family peptidase n=1 Tax=Micromonospora sp. NPDC047074 TaxID=3154339 RepID=UPI0033C86DC7